MEDRKKKLRDRRLLTFPEACEYLNVTEAWLRRRVLRREIKYTKLGNYLRFDPAWLEHYIQSHVVEPVE